MIDLSLKHHLVEGYLRSKLVDQDPINALIKGSEEAQVILARGNCGVGESQLVVCAFNLWRQRKQGQLINVDIVTDRPEKYAFDYCLRMFAPWNAWMKITSLQTFSPDASEDFWENTLTPGAYVLEAVEGEHAMDSLRGGCKKIGATLVEPVMPATDTFEFALLEEVFFHDSELGARSEFDGQPRKFSAQVLRMLSATHCRFAYPHFALEGLPQDKKPWRVMDVGCGPISNLRWGALRGEMTITGVDPLIEMYALILARHGHDKLPHLRCADEIAAYAENLDEAAPDEAYDMIYTSNALDHTQEPERVISNFSRKLVPGGRVYLAVNTREGTRQNWNQLHKTNIYLNDNNELVYHHQHTAEKPLLSPASNLRLAKVFTNTADYTVVNLERV